MIKAVTALRTKRPVCSVWSGVAVMATLSMAFAGPTGAAPRAYDEPTIVWLEPGAGNPYWDAQHKAAAEAGRRLGFRFKAVSGNLNASDQAAILRQLVDDKSVTLVMVDAIDRKTIGPSLLYARARGVKTLSVNAIDAKATASIAFNEIRSGRAAAMQALRVLRRSKAPGTVAVLEGIRGQAAGDLRAKGFIDVMKKAGVRVVAEQPTDWEADNASATMQSWLAKYPDLAIVYALSDTIAVPAMKVAADQNRLCTRGKTSSTKPSCVGFVSGEGLFLDEVVKGRLYSTALYSPYWTGFTYAKLAYQVAKGYAPQKTNLFNSLLVTSGNADCVARMVSDMEKNTTTFQFEGTLQQIAAKKYGCKILDANP